MRRNLAAAVGLILSTGVFAGSGAAGATTPNIGSTASQLISQVTTATTAPAPGATPYER